MGTHSQLQVIGTDGNIGRVVRSRDGQLLRDELDNILKDIYSGIEVTVPDYQHRIGTGTIELFESPSNSFLMDYTVTVDYPSKKLSWTSIIVDNASILTLGRLIDKGWTVEAS